MSATEVLIIQGHKITQNDDGVWIVNKPDGTDVHKDTLEKAVKFAFGIDPFKMKEAL